MIITPNSFTGDPRGWISNQLGHLVVGFVGVFAVTSIWHALTGEIPYKWLVGSAVVGFYFLVVEVLDQHILGPRELNRRRLWIDTFQDTAFVFYSVVATLLLFSDERFGSSRVCGDLDNMPWGVLIMAVLHLVGGAVWRFFDGKTAHA